MTEVAVDGDSTKGTFCTTIDLTGKVFGKWTVIRPHTKRSANGGMYWRCKCACGQGVAVSSTSLISGKSKQCKFCAGAGLRQRFCARGHDTELWGRTNSYSCRACVRDKHLRTHYGMTLADFEALFEFQKGLCSICGKQLGEYKAGKPGWGNGCRIEVDHEHGTKLPLRQTVRGLLCGGRWAGCNRKLGRIDKIDWLKSVVAYLENPPARQILTGDAPEQPPRRKKRKKGKSKKASKKIQ